MRQTTLWEYGFVNKNRVGAFDEFDIPFLLSNCVVNHAARHKFLGLMMTCHAMFGAMKQTFETQKVPIYKNQCYAFTQNGQKCKNYPDFRKREAPPLCYIHWCGWHKSWADKF